MQVTGNLLTTEYLTLAVFTFPRLAGLHAVLPLFGDRTAGTAVRNAFVFSLVIFVMPAVTVSAPEYLPTGINAIAILVKETVLGFITGFFVSGFFWTARAVGNFIEYQAGSGMAMIMNPMSGTEEGPFGQFFHHIVSVVFFISGGYLALLDMVLSGYRAWPVFSPLPALGDPKIAHLAIGMTGNIIGGILLYAFPMIFAMFLVTICLGLINRFVPALNVMTDQMPVQRGVLFVVMILYMAIFMKIVRNGIFSFKPYLEQLYSLLSP
jgi:type III secretion protein SpaR/YscT/HrcT